MDYDQSGIARTYDEARALTPARHRHWQRLLSAHVDRAAISLVVDLGCGTGRFSEMLAAELGARVIGLDPSEKMIDQARRKPATKPATSLIVFGRGQHTSFRSPTAASILCLCLRSITICPIGLESRENAGVSCAWVVTFASAPERAKMMSSCQTSSRRCGRCSTPTYPPARRSARTLRPPASR